MIMYIVSLPTQYSLFHCADRERRMEGLKMQYAPDLEEGVETVIYTLLHLLQHMFTGVGVVDHFEADTEKICQYMKWCKD